MLDADGVRPGSVPGGSGSEQAATTKVMDKRMPARLRVPDRTACGETLPKETAKQASAIHRVGRTGTGVEPGRKRDL